MVLKRLVLHNFRSYEEKVFQLDQETTYVVGPNTSGKSNLLEAIYLLSSGRGFRAEKDTQMIRFEQNLARIQGMVDETKLEVILTRPQESTRETALKKLLVNDVSKRRVDFI